MSLDRHGIKLLYIAEKGDGEEERKKTGLLDRTGRRKS